VLKGLRCDDRQSLPDAALADDVLAMTGRHLLAVNPDCFKQHWAMQLNESTHSWIQLLAPPMPRPIGRCGRVLAAVLGA